MSSSTILRLYSESEFINVAPEYQRQGGVWSIEKKQLLIDSILNNYDIPKLYFHELSTDQKIESEQDFDFSIIDGRQRVQTIWEFIDGKFPLSREFEYQLDPNVDAAGLTYEELAQKFPKIKIRFDSYVLPVILVQTDDIDLIEDMFSRLNEAVPLNGAEKRNALGGAMAKAIRDVASHPFFTYNTKLSNSRFQHREIAARLLFLEVTQLQTPGKITDTKKPYLDRMVVEYKDNLVGTTTVEAKVNEVLTSMAIVFFPSDTLLRAQSIPVYYLVFKDADHKGKLLSISRVKLQNFNELVQRNRITAEKDITLANFEYLEYDRLTQQGTNDASNLRERVRILSEYLDL